MASIAQNTPYGVVYRIRNTVTDTVYIGITIQTPVKRWRHHKSALNLGAHTNPHLQRAWDKHGAASFLFEVIETHENVDDLNAAECRIIAELQACGNALYNQKSGGGFGGSPSAETRQKLSIAGRGRIWSEEARQRLREATTGVKKHYTPETYARLIAARSVPHTEEHRRKISEAGMGRRWTDAQREKRKGLRHTEETKALISAAHRGRVRSEDTRANIRASWERRNTYIICDPEGNEYTTHNLRAFCAEHELSFFSMYDVSRGRRSSMRGWTCERKGGSA